MNPTSKVLPLAAGLMALMGCRKEVEKIVVQDKTYSWAEVKQLSGSQKIIIQMTQDVASLYLQQAGYLGRLTPLPGALGPERPGYYQATQELFQPLPYDLKNRIPMNAAFYLKPLPGNNLVLRAYPTTYLPPSNMPADIDLRRLDPAAVEFSNLWASPFFAFGAISRNNYALVGYTTAPADRVMRLVLSRLSLDSGVPTGPVTVTSRVLTVPLPNAYPYTIAAIDDYFLVNVINYGIYKINEQGIVKLVVEAPGTAMRSFLKHKGTLYAINNDRQKGVYTSTDDGETWQLRIGIPDFFAFSTFHLVGDSIVGTTTGYQTNSIYTLRWQGSTYHVRQLKNDGLNQVDVTDLAQLGDTVYLGTTGGLFKRPLKQFFESR